MQGIDSTPPIRFAWELLAGLALLVLVPAAQSPRVSFYDPGRYVENWFACLGLILVAIVLFTSVLRNPHRSVNAKLASGVCFIATGLMAASYVFGYRW